MRSAVIIAIAFCFVAPSLCAGAPVDDANQAEFKQSWSADDCLQINFERWVLFREAKLPDARTWSPSGGLILLIHVRQRAGIRCHSSNANSPHDGSGLRFRALWSDGSEFRKSEANILNSKQGLKCWLEGPNVCGGWIYTVKVDSQSARQSDRLYLMIDARDGTQVAEFIGRAPLNTAIVITSP